MDIRRIRLSQVLESQIPDFINDEFPLFKEFLRRYQESNEIPGASYDLLSNIDKYVDLDAILLTPRSTRITSNDDIGYEDTVIPVESTAGFPYAFGLLSLGTVDDEYEIVTYTSKTDTEFRGVVRGFRGLTEIGDELVFEESAKLEHFDGTTVVNLSALFLDEFFKKLKAQIAPGFEERILNYDVNERLFYKNVGDFYRSKGTKKAYEILFKALYNKPVNVIIPSDYVFESSSSSNRKTRDLVLYSDDQTTDFSETLLHRTLKQPEEDAISDPDQLSAYGTVTNVERIERNGIRYYLVSLDGDYDKDISVDGTVFGTFVTTATTKVIEDFIGVNDEWPEFLQVDSTLSFEESGTLDVYNVINNEFVVEEISYSGKTVNEFFDISDGEFDITRGTLLSSRRYAYVDISDEETHYFRVTQVLSGITPDESSYFEQDDPIKFNTLGLREESTKYNDWTNNHTATYNISNLELLSATNRTYRCNVDGEFDLVNSDKFFLIDNTNTSYNIFISARESISEYILTSDSLIDLTPPKSFVIERKLNKAHFTFFPEANNYVSDVQNVYRPDSFADEMYIAASSLPNYGNSALSTNDKRITFSANIATDLTGNKTIKIGKDGTPSTPEVNHSFYTGDSIIYSEEDDDNRLKTFDGDSNIIDLPNGRYYVTVVDTKTIKLSTSLNRVYTQDYLSIVGNVTDTTFFYSDFFDIEKVLNIDEPFVLKSKRLVKKIIPPVDQSNPVETIPGKIGIFRNGVELLNYKSKNNIYYGGIEALEILSSGEDYDIINPPTLEIFDGESADGANNGGIGATGNFVIQGSVRELKVLGGGYNYVNDPTIKVTGGNGTSCDVSPVMESYTHGVTIDSSSGFNVGISSNTIITLEDHVFSPGERVIYNCELNAQEIGGLKNKAIYFVGVIDNTSFTLHNSVVDAKNGVEAIDLIDFGEGFHKFDAVKKKKRLSALNVNYSSEDFTFKKVSYDPSVISAPIDYYTNTINLPKHGFNNGELITYDSTSTPIAGLSSGTDYYVTKVDDNNFRLSSIGIGTLSKNFYYNQGTYVDLTTAGVGRQYFRYPNIEINVTPSGNDPFSIQPQILPIVRGKITEVFLEGHGVGYGCTNIFNYERQPDITAEPGKLASVKPFIIDGEIKSIIIQNSGQKYVSTPTVQIFTDGDGFGAELIPIIDDDGRLQDVIVKNGGADYNDATEIEIVSAGAGAKFKAKIVRWNVNEVERALNSNQIYDDDGFLHQDSTISNNEADEYGLIQYAHCYAPRKLRQTVYNKKIINGRTTFNPDLVLDNLNRETESTLHSPILGWAYDGNPIYGPYGFSNSDGSGGVQRMQSGYKKRAIANRPSVTVYPLGFFCNDYEWFSDGDLDAFNGRFCVTPEYPNGVYAYFTTIGNNDSSFKNFKLPEYPYVIGERFKSTPIEFNFDASVNQGSFFNEEDDITSENYKKLGLLRNITPQNASTEFGSYKYVFNPTEVIDVKSRVKSVSPGKVDSLVLFAGGKDFKVGDKIVFSESGGNTKRPLGRVVSISGTDVSSVSVATSSMTNVEIVSNPQTGNVVAICSGPHDQYTGPGRVDDLANGDEFGAELIVVTRDLELSGIGTGTIIDVPGVTGLVTYMNVFGLAGTQNIIKILPNDVYKIKSGNFEEQVRILNVDSFNSRVRVQREVNGTIGTSYPVGTALSEHSRKFLINGYGESGSRFNTQYYFDPRESVGLGVGSTLNILNPGAGSTSMFVGGDKIYLPHNTLEINDKIYYDYDTGPIQVESFGDNFNLVKDKPYYAYPFPNGFVGVSSRPVGVGSTGPVGLGSVTELLTFTSHGAGDNHSFFTRYDDVKRVDVTTFEATFTTAKKHNLIFDDEITTNCRPNIEKTLQVFYNEENNKFAIGKFDIVHADINARFNTITINNHGLQNGQTLILESDFPPGGLVDNGVYRVSVVNRNTIKLLETNNGGVVDITNQSTGRLLVINPPIQLIKDKTLVFDVSDFSLSYVRNNIRYSAFELKFFTDKELTHEFVSSEKGGEFNVTTTGKLGVDLTARVKLKYDDDFPQQLYYILQPLKNAQVPVSYSLSSLDELNDNIIEFVDSPISGNYNVRKPTDTTFSYRLFEEPDSTNYVAGLATITYSTISTTASGPINEVSFVSKGANLIKLPLIEKVESESGIDSIIFPRSKSIGISKNIEIDDIGFDFPSDTTLRPRAFTPTVYKIDPLTSIGNIDVLNKGTRYTVLPDLVLIDGYTNKIVDDVDLRYVNEDGFRVDVIKNTKNLYDVEPRLLPINNSNGYKILTLSYDSGSKDATVILDVVGFSTITAWPFPVGSQFMVEGVITKDPTNDEGYNSADYNYKKLFTVKTADPNIGGQVPSFTFNMGDFVTTTAGPGIFNDLITSGRVIPESLFPTFNVNRVANKYFENEVITNGDTEDLVVSWDIKNELLKVFTSFPERYQVGDVIRGKTSASSGTLTEVVGITSLTYELDASNDQRYKPYDRKGFLNEETQRLHDSDYYQYFAYSLKSEVGISSWKEPVESLAHPAGFKKFSELQVISGDNQQLGINSTGIPVDQNESGFIGISDFTSYYDLNCVHDIDMVTENNILNKMSDEIRFNSLILVDYFESIGNRVLIVDDVSDEFNSNARPTAFATVDTFSLRKFRSKKYVMFTSNKKFPGERQMIIVNVLHNNIYGFLTQYGRVETNNVHGYFDIGIFEDNGLLLFYPIEYQFSDFNISGYQYAISDTISGVATHYIGNSDSIGFAGIQTTMLPQGTSASTKIVGIDSSYRSAKVLVTLESSDLQYYQYDEFNIVHDGTDIHNIEFSTLATDNFASQDVSLGIGTYQFAYNGNDLEVRLKPNSGLSTFYDVTSTVVAISDTSRTGVGSSQFNTTLTTVGLGTTTSISPFAGVNTSIQLLEFDASYKGFNAYVSIEDMTNNIVQMSELVFTHNETDSYITEFGRVSNRGIFEDVGLGTFTTYVTGGKARLEFVPYPADPGFTREIEVRLFTHQLQLVDLGISESFYNYDNGRFSTLHGTYTGTENDIKRSFELRHQGDLIFERVFDSTSLGTTVSTEENVLVLPNHFFVTGELVHYTVPNDDDVRVGIATTTIAGIGSTDKLPTDLFVVKVNDSKIKFADTAENALKFNPVTLTLDSVGVGTQHKITATNKDAKGVFTIDNMMQSPIVGLAITTSVIEDISLDLTLINTAGITSIFANDIIEIDDEVMLVETVGVGTQDRIRVRRPWLGTELGIHTAGALVTKLKGDYKIVGSTINFTSAPYGKVPVTVDVNQFGVPFVDPSDRDFTGITTNSYFHGRTFMRSGIVDEIEETYSKNYIFDDISTKFTGIRTSFDMTFNGADVVGLSTDNAIVLVKDVFQQPTRPGVSSIAGNYEFVEVGGKTKILFDGSISSDDFTAADGQDINVPNLPIGGVIVNIGSTTGLGYQPLVPAGGTATVSDLGTIASISIGNSGSGYRPGIQTHIGVKAVTPTSVDMIGFATALNGHITGVAVTSNKVFYAPRDISDVTYNNLTGLTTVTTSSAHGLLNGQEVVVSGIAFTCDYSGAGPVNITNVVYDNTTGIMTVTTSGAHNLQTTGQRSDVLLTGIAMTCGLDGGASTHVYPRTTDPYYCGSRVTAVNSSTEFETNVGVSTVPTFYQSGGVAQPVIIAPRSSNNSDSKVDSAFHGTRVTRILDNTSFEINTGISTREHFYARCGKVNKPIQIVFDSPLSYTDIPLIYSSDSPNEGIGRTASIDMFISRDTTVGEFKFNNNGYAYGQGEILTVAIGGTTGIPTDTSKTYDEFQITVNQTHSDEFNSWSVGQLQQLDSLDDQFDGIRRVFPISFQGDRLSIRARPGSQIDVSATLLIFINDVLQVPNQAYTFKGGSLIIFAEPIPEDYTSRIIFFRGTRDVDVEEIDIVEPIEVGDKVRIMSDIAFQSENKRTVEDILSSDILLTNPYSGIGRLNDETIERPLMACKQTEDLFINGAYVGKDRRLYEPYIFPTTNLIQPVGVDTTVAWVEATSTFFDNRKENLAGKKLGQIQIVSQDETATGIISAVVSGVGSVTNITIANAGVGYTFAPQIAIGPPAPGGTQATATCTVSNGSINTITITNNGLGYTGGTPAINVEPPKVYIEPIRQVEYDGDYGNIVSVANTNVGVGSTALELSLHIPRDSFIRDLGINPGGITTEGITGLVTSYYFTASRTNVGNGVTAFYNDGNTLSISTDKFNNIFQVYDIDRTTESVPGIGVTDIVKITTLVEYPIDLAENLGTFDNDSETFDSTELTFDNAGEDNGYFGNFSWGRINWHPTKSRKQPLEFTSYHETGFAGINTSPFVRRTFPLRTKLYTQY